MTAQAWSKFDGGSTIGQRGSEDGSTILDEEHPAGARITLEQDTHISPFAITCGIYGWMMHTRYFETRLEALSAYEQMKNALTEIVLSLQDTTSKDDPTQTHQVSDAIERFVDAYP